MVCRSTPRRRRWPTRSGRHLDRYFDQAVVEVEPPKGSFPFVNRCTLSGELLGPPNYHRYQQIVQQHHAARFSRMPFEQYRERIETVRDPEVVNQWLEKMKKTTRYTWKLGAEGETPVTFDSVEEARAHLLATAKDRVVKAMDSVRFPGKLIEALPPGEIRRAIEGQIERQRRFPAGHCQRAARAAAPRGFHDLQEGFQGRLVCLRGQAEVPCARPELCRKHRLAHRVHRDQSDDPAARIAAEDARFRSAVDPAGSSGAGAGRTSRDACSGSRTGLRPFPWSPR